jgi:hypothetical protein
MGRGVYSLSLAMSSWSRKMWYSCSSVDESDGAEEIEEEKRSALRFSRLAGFVRAAFLSPNPR